ncbi:Uncharacterized low-complexity proteins [Andreprevotia lacus DSM 23236]|jgi:RimJ/RimL family protein N-acetyltransferase|uniref:Uncharacterized low-complexity proteins n=1 Tax=Andreprevotia lacus DSM 23236 TaxID=1121001 RepID=A0A1W1XH17_9NEIS|nr:GNAT family N-acetyltransferase [Andreprevotia lacus]SMC23072.1 Uncharacterized low-complexity proteins [Andreprevotia lacus DSM 23236]
MSLCITTARLHVRAFTPADLDAFHALTRQSEITDVLDDWAMTREQCGQMLAWHAARYAAFDGNAPVILLAICLHADNLPIGWLGIWPKAGLPADIPEVMYALGRDHRGQGYVAEAVRAAAGFVFASGKLRALLAVVKPDNIASCRVVTQCGFVAQGTVHVAGEGDYDYYELARPPGPQLQPVQPEDAEALCAMFHRIVAHEAEHWLGGCAPYIPDHDKPGMQRYQAALGGYFWIMQEGVAAGAVHVTHSGCEHARIELLYLAPEYQSLGLGGAVLRLLEVRYPQVRRWSLDSTRHSARNLPFYRKYGFVVIGQDDDEYYLRKQIALPVPGAAPVQQQDWRGGNFRDCTLAGADLADCDLSGLQISGSNLAGLSVNNAHIGDARFNNVNLSGARIGNARLTGLALHNVALAGAVFSETSLGDGDAPGLHWQDSDLRNSRFTGCDLRGVALDGCQMDGMTIDGVPFSDLLAAYRAMT